MTGVATPRFSFCDEPKAPRFSGVLQGDLGCSTKFRVKVIDKLGPALEATAILMFWVLIVMIPAALAIGVVAGMREGSRTDRALSILSIATTSTPEYVSGVVLTIIFATWLGWLNGSAASATEERVTFYNFALPVATVALYGMGYARSSPRSSRRGSCARQAPPGAIDPHSGLPYLFGGDKLARDVFGRVIAGARIVLIIAPLATLLALSAGVMLGLPAGYSGGRVDAILSFLANPVLAFPIIVLFCLLVSPGILETPIPYVLAAVFFAFPVVLLSVLFISGYRARPGALALTLLAGLWLFATFVFNADPLKLIQVSPSTLNIFVAVALASGPGIFRIVRGLTLDIKTREYVFAAQTRGESPWYAMLWEILPNARGALIVDVCLRIGYTTILLGALGYFGLGMPPESPNWGTMINESSRFMRIYVHPALPPALALMSFVLGLNLLADAIREQSLRD